MVFQSDLVSRSNKIYLNSQNLANKPIFFFLDAETAIKIAKSQTFR